MVWIYNAVVGRHHGFKSSKSFTTSMIPGGRRLISASRPMWIWYITIDTPLRCFLSVPVMPILLQVKITIPSSELDRFFEFFQPAYDAVIAEPENSFFEVSVDKKDVAENGKVYIHLVEGWNCTIEHLTQVCIVIEGRLYLMLTCLAFVLGAGQEALLWTVHQGFRWDMGTWAPSYQYLLFADWRLIGEIGVTESLAKYSYHKATWTCIIKYEIL